MPEHIHLLMWPLVPQSPVSTVLRELKRPFAEEVIGRWRSLNAGILDQLLASDGSTRFWLRGGGYDRNIHSDEEFREKFNYIHNNPVTRGLVATPTDRACSSARWYAGDRSSPVRLDPLPPRRPMPRE